MTYAIYSTLGEEVQRDKSLKLEPMLVRQRVGHASSICMIPNPHGMTNGCGWRRITPLIARPSTRRRPWDIRSCRGHYPARRMTLPCPWSRMRTIPRRRKHLLKEAGYANGFDAGEYSCDAVYASVIEAVVNDLGAIGIRAKVQPLERAAMQAAQREKKVKNLTRMGSGAPGNAATRIEAFMYSKGRSRSSRTPTSISGSSSSHANATARSVRSCCTRFNRRCMTRPTSCRSGSWASCVSPAHGWRSPAWA